MRYAFRSFAGVTRERRRGQRLFAVARLLSQVTRNGRGSARSCGTERDGLAKKNGEHAISSVFSSLSLNARKNGHRIAVAGGRTPFPFLYGGGSGTTEAGMIGFTLRAAPGRGSCAGPQAKRVGIFGHSVVFGHVEARACRWRCRTRGNGIIRARRTCALEAYGVDRPLGGRRSPRWAFRWSVR